MTEFFPTQKRYSFKIFLKIKSQSLLLIGLVRRKEPSMLSESQENLSRIQSNKLSTWRVEAGGWANSSRWVVVSSHPSDPYHSSPKQSEKGWVPEKRKDSAANTLSPWHPICCFMLVWHFWESMLQSSSCQVSFRSLVASFLFPPFSHIFLFFYK